MSSDLLKHAAEIVEAYVSNNEVQAQELPGLIKDVFGALSALSVGKTVEVNQEERFDQEALEEELPVVPRSKEKKPIPFLPVDQSVTHEAVFCLMCGKSCKALKGHLTRSHKLDFDEYRKMYDLDKDFPMVAPAYSEKRRSLAIAAGLGEKGRDGSKKALTATA